MSPRTDRSYRALLRVPTHGRVSLGMQIARVTRSRVVVTLWRPAGYRPG